MDRDEFRMLAIGAFLYGALTYIGGFILAVLWHLDVVAVLALTGMAASYMSFSMQISLPPRGFCLGLQIFFIAASILIGAAVLILLFLAAMIGGST